ncbi:MAG: CtsR family transcriptional regulator [Oscillospiraceae bacterium]|jgi:transcriptional regulator CtsR|nr:CtsR family transcriptional regulator [Oscillospiraceae bacterium]
MKLADYIAGLIIETIEEYGGTVDISRNELAGKIGCVPSQISYVVTSRFTPERGYIVESRRGGGGFIRIKRIEVQPGNPVMHVLNSIGDSIDEDSCKAILSNIKNINLISESSMKLISAAVLNSSLRQVETEMRDKVRASIFKNMLLCL